MSLWRGRLGFKCHPPSLVALATDGAKISRRWQGSQMKSYLRVDWQSGPRHFEMAPRLRLRSRLVEGWLGLMRRMQGQTLELLPRAGPRDTC